MKQAFTFLVILAIGFGIGWFFGVRHAAPLAQKPSSPMTQPFSSSMPSKPPGVATPPTRQVTADDWRELHQAREAALKNNKELADEYKAILQDMEAQQVQLDQAMIKADPKVAPLVAKMAAMRQRVRTVNSVSPVIH